MPPTMFSNMFSKPSLVNRFPNMENYNNQVWWLSFLREGATINMAKKTKHFSVVFPKFAIQLFSPKTQDGILTGFALNLDISICSKWFNWSVSLKFPWRWIQFFLMPFFGGFPWNDEIESAKYLFTLSARLTMEQENSRCSWVFRSNNTSKRIHIKHK